MATKSLHLPLAHGQDVATTVVDLSVGDLSRRHREDTEDRLHGRRLSASRLADQSYTLPCLHREVYDIQYFEKAFEDPESDVEVSDVEEGFRHAIPPRLRTRRAIHRRRG